MKRFIIALIILGVVGCVNPYTYREDQKPVASFTTTKPAQEVSECILLEWQKVLLLTGISQQRTGKYHSILAIGDNADVYDDEGITRVKYYSLRGVMDIMNRKVKRIKGIKSCL